MTPAFEIIARVAHEANRAWCRAHGDGSQVPWEEAPAWQRESAVAGVAFHFDNPGAGPEAGHDAWMRDKAAEGWIYGPEKRPDLKQHPCMVPFDQLPPHQQAKDRLFHAIVHALLGQEPGAVMPAMTIPALTPPPIPRRISGDPTTPTSGRDRSTTSSMWMASRRSVASTWTGRPAS